MISLGTALAPPSVRAAGATVTLSASPNPGPAGEAVTLTVTVTDGETGTPVPQAHVRIREPWFGPAIIEGYADGSGVFEAAWVVPIGGAELRAEYDGVWYTAYSNILFVQGQGPSVTTLELVSSSVLEGKPFQVRVSVWNVAADAPGNFGTIVIRDVGPDAIVGTVTLDGNPETMTIPSLSAGQHELVAEFGGIGTAVFPSVSDPLVIDVVPDTAVEAENLVVTPDTFYPVADGYGDTISISGTTLEPASVSIRVYTAKGLVVRVLRLGPVSGDFASSWDGRNGAGTLLAAGTYRVELRVRDARGNVIARNRWVTLSWRKVSWITTSITKTGASYSWSAKGGSGWISKSASPYTNGVRISGGPDSSGYAIARWSYTLKSALAYKGLKIEVLGRGTERARAILAFGQDAVGSLIGPSYRWWSRSGEVAGHVNDRVVLLDVEADGPMPGAFDVAKTRVTYTYAVWQ
ncbi:MAG TPA: FlgD immunoglobulin-like domain containing protein [Candidatus Limnocylindrales bacterium]|nr:FlgD immunoglobulin-like domain containing protein [Candidatus Limnocylindrales bacterium]